MFYKNIMSALILATGLMSHQAKAEFITTDWKSQGDGLAILDTNTGIEWLKLTQTGGKSINEVKSLLGSVYAGWRLPTHDEIKTLAISIFPTVEPRKNIISTSMIASTAEQRATLNKRL